MARVYIRREPTNDIKNPNNRDLIYYRDPELKTPVKRIPWFYSRPVRGTRKVYVAGKAHTAVWLEDLPRRNTN